jgi:hypothetical protein
LPSTPIARLAFCAHHRRFRSEYRTLAFGLSFTGAFEPPESHDCFGKASFVHDLRGQEGLVFARTFWPSVVLTLALGVLVAIQQFVVPGIIPH